MKIEFLLDAHCLSVATHIEMFNKIATEFLDHDFNLIAFDGTGRQFKNLEIRLLPAWIIDNELLRINPGDYSAIREAILLKSRQEKDE